MCVLTFFLYQDNISNWRIPSLAKFMESLTQEQDNLVQKGAINPTQDQALAVCDLKQEKGNNKPKYSK